MQLCQTTEGVTDQGEIRLPAAKQTSTQSAAPASGQSASGGVGSAASSSSGQPPPPATAWAEENSNATWCSESTPASASAAPAAAVARSIAAASAASAAGSGEAAQSSGDGAGGGGEKPGAKEKEMHFESIVSELFQGHVVSTVRCLECQRTSRTKEPIYDVSVQIPSPNEMLNGQTLPPELQAQQVLAGAAKGPQWMGVLGNVTGKVKSWFYDKGVEITDCLRKFCAPEYLVGKDKYECEHCKRKTDGERKFAFRDLPEVLCIHIKRFRYDSSWFNATKNSRVVTFPVNKTLDMAPFLEEASSQPVEYRLIGLIQHIGSMGGGHYISYCQHKRKPQEWYEFDDLQVSTVSPEQVERAEPYVLFYQRQPTRGIKLDRQTFKTDQRKMEASIRQYLMGSSKAAGDDPAQAAAEEMRHQGAIIRNLYRNPPAELDVVFVSKHWYVRLTTMSQPGPIDNYEYLCPHKLLGCYSPEMAAEPFIPISKDLFNSLTRKYGGGPAIPALEICKKCQAHLHAFNDRKQAEYDLVSKYDTKDTGDGKGWYLVDALWVNKWKRYVKTEHVTDIRDMCAPGPVSNERLFDKNGAIKDKLKIRIDYIGVNGRVWWLFQHVHGGGPAICREDLDIFSASHRLETELMLEEFGTSAANLEFSQRISWQYVDECQGDAELYKQRYHGVCPVARPLAAGADPAHEDAAAVAASVAAAASAASAASAGEPAAAERQHGRGVGPPLPEQPEDSEQAAREATIDRSQLDKQTAAAEESAEDQAS